ncbi:MAG: CDP-alcohol phosphatidyltransferase family protein [Candidatus Thermoplasmatota archaeon]|nr:CDP-alcohol phosphatidyltransferase family protein [Candidatus Thermoplasmatota archaeon]
MEKKGIVSMLSFADSFTIVNGLLGLFSIFLVLSGETRWAFSFILLAVLADGMDGAVARKFRKLSGDIGKYMDEFSDMISFCAAPLVIVYSTYNASFNVTIKDIFILFSCGLFLLGGMLHLIRYHIGNERYFIGLTTPAAAITVVTMCCLSLPWWGVLVTLIGLSIIMISNIPYPKIEGLLSVPAVVLILLAAISGKDYSCFLLLAGIMVYIFFGPIYAKYSLKSGF